jgi:hypothetical protein
MAVNKQSMIESRHLLSRTIFLENAVLLVHGLSAGLHRCCCAILFHATGKTTTPRRCKMKMEITVPLVVLDRPIDSFDYNYSSWLSNMILLILSCDYAIKSVSNASPSITQRYNSVMSGGTTTIPTPVTAVPSMIPCLGFCRILNRRNCPVFFLNTLVI